MSKFLKNMRPVVDTWYHLIQTQLSSGESKVLVTLCGRRRIEELKKSMEVYDLTREQKYVYSIDSTKVYEPNRRCDQCSCP
jgi:hypothetical protein